MQDLTVNIFTLFLCARFTFSLLTSHSPYASTYIYLTFITFTAHYSILPLFYLQSLIYSYFLHIILCYDFASCLECVNKPYSPSLPLPIGLSCCFTKHVKELFHLGGISGDFLQHCTGKFKYLPITMCISTIVKLLFISCMLTYFRLREART